MFVSTRFSFIDMRAQHTSLQATVCVHSQKIRKEKGQDLLSNLTSKV